MKEEEITFVVDREQCPECHRQGKDTSCDNLARYNDGHAHCFACGHHETPAVLTLRKPLR